MLDDVGSPFPNLYNPSHLDFEHHQQMGVMLSTLRSEGDPLRVLHLGGADCALARTQGVTRSGSQQVVIEIGEALVSQVQAWFDLPRSPRLRVRVGDTAEAMVGLRPDQWDVVVRDVFNGGSAPASYRNRELLNPRLKALAPGRLLLVNTASVSCALAGAEIATLTGALGRDAPHTFIVADPIAACGRRRGNLVLVVRRDSFTEDELEEAERVVHHPPPPVCTRSLGDTALPYPEGVQAY